MPAIQLISAVPTFATREEHSSLVEATPNSFSDLPAVIQHKEENVTVALDPPLPDFTPDDLKGTLYILTSVLAFFSNTGRGFQIEYPSITLHAVSRAESGPSIYCQLDDSSPDQTASQDDDFTAMCELNIIPSSPNSLEPIFEALSSCASLHPDKNEAEDDGDLDDAFVDPSTFETFNGDENEELSEVGRAALAHLESTIYNPFEDAEASADTATGGNDTESKNGEEKMQRKA